MRYLRFFSVSFLLVTAFVSFADEPVLKFTLTKADGTHATYEFLLPDSAGTESSALPREEEIQRQHNAGVASLSWAKQFYAAHEIYLRSVELKDSPAPYYLAKFDGELSGARQVFFAVVLTTGSVLAPVELPPGS
jgi:hypothetical protein